MHATDCDKSRPTFLAPSHKPDRPLSSSRRRGKGVRRRAEMQERTPGSSVVDSGGTGSDHVYSRLAESLSRHLSAAILPNFFRPRPPVTFGPCQVSTHQRFTALQMRIVSCTPSNRQHDLTRWGHMEFVVQREFSAGTLLRAWHTTSASHSLRRPSFRGHRLRETGRIETLPPTNLIRSSCFPSCMCERI